MYYKLSIKLYKKFYEKEKQADEKRKKYEEIRDRDAKAAQERAEEKAREQKKVLVRISI